MPEDKIKGNVRIQTYVKITAYDEDLEQDVAYGLCDRECHHKRKINIGDAIVSGCYWKYYEKCARRG